VTERRGRGRLLLDLHYASRLAERLLDEEMAAVGVRAEWAGLLTEIRTVEPVRPTELAQRTGIAPATLYDYVEQLVAEGMLERTPNPDDGRSQLLVTTRAGKLRVNEVSTAVRAVHRRFAEELGMPLADAEAVVADLRFAFERALNADAT
jgi:DNA-binding MarR family transcriptional regulator